MTDTAGMSNVLSDDKKQQVLALGRLGWPLRRIEDATGVRRETASAYLKAAGIAVRPPGGWGRLPAKPAKEVSTDSGPSGPKPAKEVSTDPGPCPSREYHRSLEGQGRRPRMGGPWRIVGPARKLRAHLSDGKWLVRGRAVWRLPTQGARRS
jgi:hypothetical protein